MTFRGASVSIAALPMTLTAAWTIGHEFHVQRAQASTRLEAVAELRAGQAKDWIERRMQLAFFLDDSVEFAELFLRWQMHSDAAAGVSLLQRARELSGITDAEAVTVVDAGGAVLAGGETGKVLSSDAREALKRSIAARESTRTLVHFDEADGTPHIEIVVPLLKTGTPAHGAVVYSLSPAKSLFHTLAAWPVPSRTAETILWKRAGADVVNINDRRGQAQTAGKISVAYATSPMLAARVMRGDAAPSHAVTTVDYRGEPVLAVASPVAATSWLLESKMDVAEVEEQAWRNAYWTMLALMLGFLGLGLGSYLHGQRLMLARRQKTEEDLGQLVKERTAALQTANDALARSRDQAETATRLKSAFVANMSHEIRTPMNAIIGLTHLMSREARDDKQKDRLRKISTAGQHLLRIVNDVLDLSKIEADKLKLEREEFAVAAVVEEALEMVAASASDKGLRLLVDCARLPRVATGDAVRLRQVLINLLSNAVKFTDSGAVRLRGEVTAQDDDGVLVRFEIEDTGPGISPKDQVALFSAFEQGDNSASRRHGGTGLGLALSRRLAAAMGGETGVVSQLGAGSTFWFTARLGRHDDTASPSTARAAVRGLGSKTPFSQLEQRLRSGHAGRRILLAEDNPVNREVAQELLSECGLVVETAEDGNAAVHLALTRHYDAILMDQQMPIMDGLAAAKQILANATKEMPIIALTANTLEEDRQACMDAGMVDHVSKPVDPEDLFRVLLRWLPA